MLQFLGGEAAEEVFVADFQRDVGQHSAGAGGAKLAVLLVGAVERQAGVWQFALVETDVGGGETAGLLADEGSEAVLLDEVDHDNGGGVGEMRLDEVQPSAILRLLRLESSDVAVFDKL